MNLLPWLILVLAYGACVGSFLNVLAYRLPEGLSVVSPPSACPTCKHRLAWYDNLPVLGWLWLRGKCRYCRTSISVQYPIIEAVTALLFAGLFAFFYMTDVRPPWREAGVLATWPALLVHLVLIAALLAATLIDARLFIIPLGIPRVATLVALIGLPLATLAYPLIAAVHPGTLTAIAPRTGDWLSGEWSLGAAAGGMLGLLFACVLLHFRLLPRSFMDADPQVPPAEQSWSPFEGLGWEALFAAGLVGLGVVLWFVHDSTGWPMDEPRPGWPVVSGQAVLILMAAAAVALAFFGVQVGRSRRRTEKKHPTPKQTRQGDTPAEWMAYPHARREMLKECLFVVWPVVGAVLGIWLPPVPNLPNWLAVLAGCGLGYLAGAALVWGIRILGSLAFGKEAMGLGDVHLMGAIGAVLGWLDATVAFFIAPFFGIAAYFVLKAVGRLMHAEERVIPYGPYLAGAAVIVQIIGGREILLFFGILMR